MRLAVEYNPKDESLTRSKSRQERFLDVVLPERPRLSKAFDLQAYVIPIYNPYENDPTYYRTGSPYQQIIDIKEYERLQSQPEPAGNTKMYGKVKDEKYKIICHLTNWAYYRAEAGRFAPENLDGSLCTDIVYSFASLDPQEFVIREFDPWVDIENNLFARTINLANGKPVYLSVGGWTDSTDGKYSKMVSDKALREKFIDSSVPFLKRFGFSGILIDWNYPTCPQSDCKAGDEKDKKNFVEFIKVSFKVLKPTTNFQKNSSELYRH